MITLTYSGRVATVICNQAVRGWAAINGVKYDAPARRKLTIDRHRALDRGIWTTAANARGHQSSEEQIDARHDVKTQARCEHLIRQRNGFRATASGHRAINLVVDAFLNELHGAVGQGELCSTRMKAAEAAQLVPQGLDLVLVY